MITSKSNPKVKLIRDLRDPRKRTENGLFFVEGIKLVGDSFSSKWKIESIIFSPELLRSTYGIETIEKARSADVEVVEVSKDVFQSISDKDGPQGIGAIVHLELSLLDKIASKCGVWVGLDSVQDAGNLGTIMRTVDSAGGRGVVLLGNCVDPFSPEAVRASMGAIFSIDLIHTDFDSFLDWQRQFQYLLIGSSDKGRMHYRSSSYAQDMILLMGSEQKGLNPALTDICSKIVAIPMRGSSDSLNLAVATGIILYEIMDQNEKSAEGGRV
jgi:TrmH family RNA methyltransferase